MNRKFNSESLGNAGKGQNRKFNTYKVQKRPKKKIILTSNIDFQKRTEKNSSKNDSVLSSENHKTARKS